MTQRISDRKSLYVKETLKLFLKYGVRSVTIGQITSQLNISSKTLYQLFEDKTGLVRACFELYLHSSRQAFADMEMESTNVADLLIRFYNKMVETFTRINANFFNDLASYFPDIWSADGAFSTAEVRMILERGVREGIFMPNISLDICAQTLTLLLRSMFEREPDHTHSSQTLLSNVLWPYVRGICTPQGLEEFRKYRRFTQAY
ncbi:MAG: TetR/AcrR family transcriptional regulator [Bacteroidia bacterium]|jgi:AcrR family transcriptional regulator|nr:TetR/AcrR family transcriptional regulator [Bacteroidia bacterium]